MRVSNTFLKEPITQEAPQYYIVHPLDDRPEQKVDVNRLGPMRMTPAVRFALLTLRVYLVGMGILVGWRVLDLAGILAHQPLR